MPDENNISSDKNQNEKSSKDNSLEAAASQSPSQSSKYNIATFNNQYYINLGNELSDFSTADVKAYATGTTREKPEGLFCMVCNPRYTPRTNVTKNYKELANATLPKLVAHGRATRSDGTAFYCYIYQATLGKRLYKDDKEIAMGWRSDKIIEKLLIPIVMSLKELQLRDVTHGNIRCSNLYDGGKEDFDTVKLGECLSAPASYRQPTIYEPIERAMAAPIGRGEGTIKDDLYALGVLLAMHVRNFDPMRGKTDDEIISSKVVNGSYSTVIGTSDRTSSGISDLLRGLLTDIEKNRWSLEEVLEWLDGRKPSIKQNTKIKKASRALKFDGTGFLYAKTLAYRLFQKPEDAVHLIESNELTHWIERSLSNQEMLHRVNLAMSAAKEGTTGLGYWDRFLPMLSIAIDHEAPIRFRNMSFHLNALGNVMADAFVQKKGLNNFMDLFNNGVLYFWITVVGDMNIDISAHVQQFDKIKGFLRQKGIVYGIERCLYFLNPSIHCFSPIVQDYFATDSVQYLTSLDLAAKKLNGKYPEKIIDQHGACFLISRDNKLIEPYAFDLSSGETHRHILATFNILSTIQKYNDVGPLPQLTDWVCSLLNPIIERYHDSEHQKKIREEIAVKKANGNLSEILAIIENTQQVKKDQVSYRRALMSYRELEMEAEKLRAKLSKPKYFAERTGREWAATISGVISTFIIIGFLMVHYGTGAPM